MLLVQKFDKAAQKRDFEIGSRIRRAREALGYSQKDLAAMCSFSERSLGSYERGEKDARKHLQEIAPLVRKSVVWLLYGREEESLSSEEFESLQMELVELREMVMTQFAVVTQLLEDLRSPPSAPKVPLETDAHEEKTP